MAAEQTHTHKFYFFFKISQQSGLDVFEIHLTSPKYLSASKTVELSKYLKTFS